MLKRSFTLVFLLIAGFSILYGQEVYTAERYLEMVSERYSAVRDYEANIEIRSGNSTMSGTVSHLSPSFVRIDFARPADQVIVFNGEALTIYLPDYRSVLVQNVSQRGGRAAPTMATGQGLTLLRRNYVPSFVTGPNPEPLDGGGERVVRLKLTRRTTSEGFREIILSINAETRLIRRIEGITIAGGEVRFDFLNIKTNIGIPQQRFAYDTPANANIYNNFLFRDTD